jgi:hypothetical protein
MDENGYIVKIWKAKNVFDIHKKCQEKYLRYNEMNKKVDYFF